MEFKRDLFMSPGLGDIWDSPSGMPHKWHHSVPEDKESQEGKRKVVTKCSIPIGKNPTCNTLCEVRPHIDSSELPIRVERHEDEPCTKNLYHLRQQHLLATHATAAVAPTTWSRI